MTDHLVHNERVKLTATLLNGVAVVCVAAAVVQNLFLAATRPIDGGGGSLSVFVFFLLVSACLHGAALSTLGSLKIEIKEPAK
jgi:hypothetical protein